MSTSTLSIILDRIKSAPPSSPIAVFRCSVAGQLNAVFGATWTTLEEIKTSPDYIGSFHGEQHPKVVRAMLEQHIT